MIKHFVVTCCFFAFTSASLWNPDDGERTFAALPANFPQRVFPTHPNQENFTLTSWSELTECTKMCGGGTRERSRMCVGAETGTPAPMSRCTGRSYGRKQGFTSMEILRRFLDGNDHMRETQKLPCNVEDCRLSEWTAWSKCSQPCGSGDQSSFRVCLNDRNQTLCDFERFRYQTCNAQPCYILSNWSEFGNCTRSCGRGLRSRSRTCQPNIDPNHPQYTTIKSVIDDIESATLPNIVIRRNLHLVIQYMQSCHGSRTENTFCNNKPCPTCPQNQMWFSCKPCHQQRCYRTNNIISQFVSGTDDFFSSIFQRMSGCSGACESGCGCPALSPYLGSDGRCYMFLLQCPINRGIRVDFSGRIPGFGSNFHVTVPPTPMDFRSTNAPPPLTTTPPPMTSSPVTDVAVARSLPKCVYGILIATTPGRIPCNCDGILQTTQCYTVGDTSCPVICNPPRKLRCPNAPLKPDDDCMEKSTCMTDTECSSGEACCRTRCGLRCRSAVSDHE